MTLNLHVVPTLTKNTVLNSIIYGLKRSKTDLTYDLTSLSCSKKHKKKSLYLLCSANWELFISRSHNFLSLSPTSNTNAFSNFHSKDTKTTYCSIQSTISLENFPFALHTNSISIHNNNSIEQWNLSLPNDVRILSNNNQASVSHLNWKLECYSRQQTEKMGVYRDLNYKSFRFLYAYMNV